MMPILGAVLAALKSDEDLGVKALLNSLVASISRALRRARVTAYDLDKRKDTKWKIIW